MTRTLEGLPLIFVYENIENKNYTNWALNNYNLKMGILKSTEVLAINMENVKQGIKYGAPEI